MKKYLSYSLSGVAILLLAGGLSSCKKEDAALSLASSSSAKPNLTVGLPPILMGWGPGTSIPYTDGIPNDVVTNNIYPRGFAINGKGYVCGSILVGTRTASVSIGDLWQWDPATKVWTQKATCPRIGDQLVGCVNFVIGDNAYFVIGTETWQYNQPTDIWTQKSSVASPHRFDGTGFALNGKGYIGLGINQDAQGAGTVDLNDWWEYDPTLDRWTQKGNFAGNSRDGAGGFAIDGKGYVVSGYHSAGQTGEWGRTVWQYDPTSDQWAEKAKFPGTARVDAVAANATIGGADVGLFVGGELENGAGGDSWEYYPPNDSWARLPNGGGGLRSQAAGFVIGNSLYVANIAVIILGWSR